MMDKYDEQAERIARTILAWADGEDSPEKVRQDATKEILDALRAAATVQEGCVMFDDGTVYDIGILHQDGRPKGSPRDWWNGGTWVTPGMKVIECYPRESASKAVENG